MGSLHNKSAGILLSRHVAAALGTSLSEIVAAIELDQPPNINGTELKFYRMAKILVIDDEPSVTASLEQALRMAGHKVMLAANGLEGTKQHSAEPADLVITDMFMPEQDGVQTILQFRKLFPGVPVIAMTGNPNGDILTVAQRLGAVAVFEKPFSTDDLLKAVDKALKRG